MIGNKRVLAVVPARGGSKGVKLKNLREIAGVPLVGLVGQTASKVDAIDRLIVSTDHEQIAQVAENYGIEVPFMRPEPLSGDRVSDVEVLNHAICEMEKLDRVRYDIVLMLQPTSPMRTRQHIEEALNIYIDEGADSLWSLSETDSKGHPYKQHLIDKNTIEYFCPEAHEIVARQQLSKTYHKNGIVYVLDRDLLLDHKTLKGRKCVPYIVEEFVANIDTELDIIFAEFYMSRQRDISING